MTDDTERLLAFGRMGLETGQYQQAREDFEKVLALDPSNREAMKGLARVNEILSRREALAVKPIQAKPVKPPRKVATTNKLMYGLAAILVLAVVTLVWMAYIMFIEPPREAAVAPTAAAIHTEIPKPTLKLLPTPTRKRPVPTLTPTPTRKPPTLTPRPTEMAGVSKEEGALAEEAYKKEVCKVTERYAGVVSGLFRLVGAGSAVGYSQKPEELLGEEFTWSFSIYADGARGAVPSRWEKDVAYDVSAYQEWVELEGKMLHTLEPPASYQDAHQELVQATKQIDHAVVFLLEVTGEVNAIYKSIRDDWSAQATKEFEKVTPGAMSLIIYDEEVSEANTERVRQAQDKLKQVAVEMYTAGLVLFSTPICDRR